MRLLWLLGATTVYNNCSECWETGQMNKHSWNFGPLKSFGSQLKILFYRDHYRSQTTELLFQKMPNFTTNQKFLENFVLIFAKDNTDCFLFCNLGSTLLKREDLLKFVFFFEVAYLKIRSCAQCYCIWRFLVTNFNYWHFW